MSPSEIDYDNPVVLSMYNNPTYGVAGHSTCAYGYYLDDWIESVALYDTLDTSTHYVLFGNWSSAVMTWVHY